MSTNRITKSFSVEADLFEELQSSRGSVSTSERVNQLLRAGLEAERRRSLHEEAALFFSSESAEDKKARRAFQSASVRSITRD